MPDPLISADLRTLEFRITSLAEAESITYGVVEIIGGKRNQWPVNRATAFANAGLISNEATAMIRLREDLFRSTGTIIGRVLEADLYGKPLPRNCASPMCAFIWRTGVTR